MNLFAVYLKLTQHCKSTTLQLKNNKIKLCLFIIPIFSSWNSYLINVVTSHSILHISFIFSLSLALYPAFSVISSLRDLIE